MSAYELLYTLRRAAEQRIIECDAWIARQPDDEDAIRRRRSFARLAARFHAKIERLEFDAGEYKTESKNQWG